MQGQNVFSAINNGQLNMRPVLSLTIHVYWLSKKSGPKGPDFLCSTNHAHFRRDV